MLNERLSEKQVCLVTALKVTIATLKRLCKVFTRGVDGDRQLTHGVSAGKGHLLTLNLPWFSHGIDLANTIYS